MPVSFNRIPDNVRAPLFYAEVDNSQANFFQQNQRALLLGPKLSSGTQPADDPIVVTRLSEAKAYFGAGSALARMFEIYRRNDPFGEVWAVACDDDAAAVDATGTITLTGTATESGVLSVYIAGTLVSQAVPAAASFSAAGIGAALAATINANADLPVTASSATGVVTITAKHGGLIGNDIDLQINMLGASQGEVTPAGLSVAITQMQGGSPNGDVTDALAAVAGEEFDAVACAYTDVGTLNRIRDAFDDVTGRWSWTSQIYGHVFCGRHGTHENLLSFGAAQNNQHASVLGGNGFATTPEEIAAAVAAAAIVSVREDPARPLQTLPLIGVQAPKMSNRFTLSERNALLFSGVSTFTVRQDGVVQLERVVTMYQVNAFGDPDSSYLDVTTLYTLMEVIRRLRTAITSKFPRHKLANNGTRFGAGQAIVTPNIIRAELIAQYSEMEALGMVENVEAFKAALIVERNQDDPNRVDVLYGPDLVNQLRVFAVLAQFRLQY